METILLKSLLPEMFVSFALLCQLIFNNFLVNKKKLNFLIIDYEVIVQIFFILICVLYLFCILKIEGNLINFIFCNDESVRSVKIILVIFAICTLPILLESFILQNLNFFEYFSVYLLALLSLFLLVSSGDLLSFYLTLEMQSLCFYILAAFNRNSVFSTEAGLKYFIAGSFISGIFLFGSSLVYFALGTLNLSEISLLLSFDIANNETKAILQLGFLFIVSILLFKIACAPFHFWAPDVYEGSPLSSTIIFSIIPKFPIIYFLIKLIATFGLVYNNDFLFLLLIIGLFSTFLGTFFAFNQKRLKKLIIYSSIAQIGFIVCALSLNSVLGYSAGLFYLVIYIITSLLIWGHITLFYIFQTNIGLFKNISIKSLFITNFANFALTNYLWALSFIIIFFSIAGIPPLSGFLSKIFVLIELIRFDFKVVATVLVIISAISVYYYIQILKITLFETNYKLYFYTLLNQKSFNKIYVLFSFGFCLLIFTFFYPSFLYLSCQYLILNCYFY